MAITPLPAEGSTAWYAWAQGVDAAARAASAVDLTNAVGILKAGLSTRAASPCRVVFAGSSTTFGSGASAKAKRYVDRLVAYLQATYPSGLGSETTVVDSTSAAFGTLSAAAGVHGYNAGEAGTSSGNYLTSAEITSIGSLNPRAVFHMVGANDYQAGTAPAVMKSNVQAKIADLEAAIAGPCVHILVQSYQRLDVPTPSYPWSAYGDALREVAAADPDRVAYIDVSEPFRLSGVPGSDPLALIADTVHPSDSGHGLLADLLRDALSYAKATAASTSTTPDTTAPAVPTGLTATASTGQVALSWTASSDNVAVTGYKVRRGGTLIASPSTTNYTDTGLSNGTTYSYTVSAVDAAGNESAQTSAVTATPTGTTRTVLAADTFDRADAASLGTASDGKTWTQTSTWAISGNRANGTGNSYAFLQASATDQEVSVDIIWTSGSIAAGVSVNASTANDRLTFYIDRANSLWRFAKVDAGTLTVLQSSAFTVTDGTTYTLRCISKDSVLTYFINGSQVGTYTLTTAEATKYKALTQAGIRASASVPVYFDSFQVLAPL